MTEACRGDEGILTPKFDTQQKVYEQVLSDLETANSLFDESESLSSTDLLYDGDVRKWRKFANSLHMRSLLSFETFGDEQSGQISGDDRKSGKVSGI